MAKLICILRLNSFPFRKIQFYIQYKSLFDSSPVYFAIRLNRLNVQDNFYFKRIHFINPRKFAAITNIA